MSNTSSTTVTMPVIWRICLRPTVWAILTKWFAYGQGRMKTLILYFTLTIHKFQNNKLHSHSTLKLFNCLLLSKSTSRGCCVRDCCLILVKCVSLLWVRAVFREYNVLWCGMWKWFILQLSKARLRCPTHVLLHWRRARLHRTSSG